MPLGTIIGGILLWVAGSLVTRVLIGLGVGAIAFVGIDTFMTDVESYVVANYHQLPQTILAICGLLKLGVATKIILSAGSIALTLKGLKEGSIIKMFMGVRGIGSIH